ncbi:AbrB/MazE/SpoVT family DNA-binding domain-containing protein [Candidatus Microgenomates bacterium]|nr:AbrB/MazE/SpoVT family DNA-binding domain-containing protein [Candidatus Microgenomates bacterium]
MTQKVFRTGNSLAVVVPVNFVKLLGVKPKDSVEVLSQPERGRVIYKFSGALQLPLSQGILKNRRRTTKKK